MAHVEPPEPPDDDVDEVVVLRDVTWGDYEALLRMRGERKRPKLAYLDGVLELMTTSRRHEYNKTLIARLLEAYGDECGVDLIGAGEATFKEQAEEAGAEPDECYFVGTADDKFAPDVVLEVVHKSGGVRKLEIYRRLGAREVWFFIKGHFWVYVLDNDRYVEVRESRFVPGIDLEEIARIVTSTTANDQPHVARAFRDKLRRRQ